MNDDLKIEKLLSILGLIMEENKNRVDFPTEFTFRHFLERLETSLRSISVLHKDGWQRHEHAIGLLLRNVISDSILCGYWIKFSKSEGELSENILKSFYAEIRSLERHIEKQHGFGEISDLEKENHLKQLADKGSFPGYIKSEGLKNNWKGNMHTMAGMIKFIQTNNKGDSWSNRLIHSFEVWKLFSQYEHFNYFSYHTTRHIEATLFHARLNEVLILAIYLVKNCAKVLRASEPLVKLDDWLRRIESQ